VITQAPLPLNERTLQAALLTELALPEIQERVVGGTISRSAYSRSARVSSEGSYSDSLEISESADPVSMCDTAGAISKRGVRFYQYPSNPRRPPQSRDQPGRAGSARLRPQ
jgi:hypothetical protein